MADNQWENIGGGQILDGEMSVARCANCGGFLFNLYLDELPEGTAKQIANVGFDCEGKVAPSAGDNGDGLLH